MEPHPHLVLIQTQHPKLYELLMQITYLKNYPETTDVGVVSNKVRLAIREIMLALHVPSYDRVLNLLSQDQSHLILYFEVMIDSMLSDVRSDLGVSPDIYMLEECEDPNVRTNLVFDIASNVDRRHRYLSGLISSIPLTITITV